MTVNLLNTPFPMRGELARREPEMLEHWRKTRKWQSITEKRIKQNAAPMKNRRPKKPAVFGIKKHCSKIRIALAA